MESFVTLFFLEVEFFLELDNSFEAIRLFINEIGPCTLVLNLKGIYLFWGEEELQ